MNILNIPRYLNATKLSFRLFLLPSISFEKAWLIDDYTLHNLRWKILLTLHFFFKYFKGSNKFRIFHFYRMDSFKSIFYY